jgi:hypothetical protein
MAVAMDEGSGISSLTAFLIFFCLLVLLDL